MSVMKMVVDDNGDDTAGYDHLMIIYEGVDGCEMSIV